MSSIFTLQNVACATFDIILISNITKTQLICKFNPRWYQIPDTAKISRRSHWCSAGKWAFPALAPMGHTFHFLDVPGSRPSPQYIFFIHNHQLWLLFSPILYTLSTTIHTIIPTKYQTISYSKISKYHSYFPSRYSISLSNQPYSPTPGTLSPDKNMPKYTSIPSPTCAHKSLNFS